MDRLSRLSQGFLNPNYVRVRAAEDAPRGPFRVLERRHGLAEIVERGVGVCVERVAKFVSAGTGCDAAGFTYTGEEASWHVVHPHPMSSYVADWKDVVSTLKGTRFEKFLAMDGSSPQ